MSLYIPNYTISLWMSLNVLDCPWMSLNVLECPWISLNVISVYGTCSILVFEKIYFQKESNVSLWPTGCGGSQWIPHQKWRENEKQAAKLEPNPLCNCIWSLFSELFKLDFSTGLGSYDWLNCVRSLELQLHWFLQDCSKKCAY